MLGIPLNQRSSSTKKRMHAYASGPDVEEGGAYREFILE